MEREALNGKFVSSVEVDSNNLVVNAFEYYNLEAIEPEDLEEYVSESENFNVHQFSFDHVFGSSTKQKQIFEEMGMPVVNNVLRGFNGSILAYGQTGTGKTHTMEGFVFANPGMIHKKGNCYLIYQKNQLFFGFYIYHDLNYEGYK